MVRQGQQGTGGGRGDNERCHGGNSGCAKDQELREEKRENERERKEKQMKREEEERNKEDNQRR